jgi:hypothetical protein
LRKYIENGKQNAGKGRSRVDCHTVAGFKVLEFVAAKRE